MPHLENNHEEWKEIRSRVDSIANTIFLIAGGALSLSITVALNNKATGTITESAASLTVSSWYWLLTSILSFLALKAYLVFQAFLFQFHTDIVNKRLALLNLVSWIFGGIGFVSFVWGLSNMVRAATWVIGH